MSQEPSTEISATDVGRSERIRGKEVLLEQKGQLFVSDGPVE